MKMVDGIIKLPASNRTDYIEKLSEIHILLVSVSGNIMYSRVELNLLITKILLIR